MAYREYIGSRYVPIFGRKGETTTDWDNSAPYEPLTVVTYQGNSYISRQYVPTGIEITNTMYWIMTGNFNAQLQEYITQVQNVSSAISDLGDILPASAFDSTNTVDARFDTLESAVSDLGDLLPTSAFDSTNTVDARFDTIEANSWVETDRIANNAVTNAKIANSAVTTEKIADANITLEKLTTNVRNQLKTRNYILLGDSFGKGLHPVVGGYERCNDGWLIFCKNVIEGRTNCNVYTNTDLVQVGNHGFASSARFIDSLELMSDSIPDKLSITDIVVMAGTNDSAYAGSDLQTAITNFMQYCAANYPNAQVSIGCLGSNIDTLQNVARDYMTCRAYGAHFIYDVYGLFCLKEYVSTDNVHLTTQGYNFYSRYLMEAVLTGECHFNFIKDIDLDTATLPTGYNIPNPLKFRYIINQNGVNLVIRPDSANVASLNAMCIRDNTQDNTAASIDIGFTHKITLPRYYDIITSDILRKSNESGLESDKTFEIISAARACIYTTSSGLTMITTSVNVYLSWTYVEWLIMSCDFFIPWLNYQNPSTL